MNSPTEVVVQEFLGAGLAIHSGKDAGIGSAIKDPVGCRKVGKILFVTDVPYPNVNTEGTQWLEVGLAPLADKTVYASDTDAGKILKKPTGDDGSGEATNSGDEDFHDLLATGFTRGIRVGERITKS
jgi:hypothetical protein